MSNKCRAYSRTHIGKEKPDNKKAFYLGWDEAKKDLYPLPDNMYDSKDWKQGSYNERVLWLHLMYEDCKSELHRTLQDLEKLLNNQSTEKTNEL